MAPALSTRSAGVRRLMAEAAELQADTCPEYDAAPTDDDLFNWHFTIKGPGEEYEGGIYHGKLVLPAEYPFKPPEVYMLTPSGRFEVNKKICLSISSFHPESWQPSWGIRTALVALMAFFSSDPKGAVGSMNASPDERRRLAAASRHFKCSGCSFEAAIAIKAESEPTISVISDSGPSTSAAPPAGKVEVVPSPHSEPPQPHEAPLSTPVFPSPSLPPSPAANTMHHTPPLDMNPIPALAPPLPVLQHQAAGVAPALPVEVLMGAETFSGMNGGGPLVVDRVILAVLLLLLAMIVRKIA